jgi:hypothetical protein
MNKPEPKKEIQMRDELTEFLLYTAPGGGVKVEAFLHNENIWLSQKRIADLFGVDRSTVTKHLGNIFEDEELDEEVVCAIFAHTTSHGAIEGKTQSSSTKFYNLDAILSVGYRVSSLQATQFRIWATAVLKDYIIKGFAMDDSRLKNGQYFGKDYFQELLERVRSIRTSERRIYLQITDIFAECAIDYNKSSDVKKNFFATVQNKFHYAIHGQTSAEKIHATTNKDTQAMGLTTWKNSPAGRILKSDVTVAKNYLTEDEIKKLERTISSYFDYIENQLEKKNEFTMERLADSVGKFLEFNDFKVLDRLGSISKKVADTKAEGEYDEFNKTQIIDSDFEKEIRNLKKD